MRMAYALKLLLRMLYSSTATELLLLLAALAALHSLRRVML